MDAKALRALARRARNQAKRQSETGPTIHHPRIQELADAVTVTNQELRLRTVDTLALVLRRLRLGFDIVRRPRTKKTSPVRQKSPAGRRG